MGNLDYSCHHRLLTYNIMNTTVEFHYYLLHRARDLNIGFYKTRLSDTKPVKHKSQELYVQHRRECMEINVALRISLSLTLRTVVLIITVQFLRLKQCTYSKQYKS